MNDCSALSHLSNELIFLGRSVNSRHVPSDERRAVEEEGFGRVSGKLRWAADVEQRTVHSRLSMALQQHALIGGSICHSQAMMLR